MQLTQSAVTVLQVSANFHVIDTVALNPQWNAKDIKLKLCNVHNKTLKLLPDSGHSQMTFVVQIHPPAKRGSTERQKRVNTDSEYNRSTTDVVYYVIVLCGGHHSWNLIQAYKKWCLTVEILPAKKSCSLRETRATGYVGADVCRWLTEGGDGWCRYLHKVKPQGTHQTHSGSRKVIRPSQRAFPLIGIIQLCHRCQRSR